MTRRYSLIVMILLLFTSLSAWVRNLESPSPSPGQVKARFVGSPVSESDEHRRLDLLEFLDHVIERENYYHSIRGTYSSNLGEMGLEIPHTIFLNYEIRVDEASQERLKLTAERIGQGIAPERVSINQAYELNGTFSVPRGRVAFLAIQAARQLKRIEESPPGQTPEEIGIFKGYFRYSSFEQENGKRTSAAVGILPPVLGSQMSSRTVGEQFSQPSLALSDDLRILNNKMPVPKSLGEIERILTVQTDKEAQIRELSPQRAPAQADFRSKPVARKELNHSEGLGGSSEFSGSSSQNRLIIEPISPTETH